MFENFANNLSAMYQGGNISPLIFLISFLGGLLSSLSPCTLGIIPLIIGYVGGYGDSDKFKTFLQLSSFVSGLAFVLSVIGVVCALTGSVFASFGGNYFILFLASFILIMGLNLIGLLEFNFSPIVKRFPKGNSKSLFLYPFLIGMLFAFASSPCSTPILAGIMGFATLSKNILSAIIMLFLFSIGQGLIIILSGVFVSFLKGIKKLSNISEWFIKLSGALLVVAAILMYFKVFSRFF